MATDLSNRTAWIRGFMKEEFTLYRERINPNSDGHGKPAHEGWDTIYVAQSYGHQPTRNFEQPSIGGRILQPSAISAEWGDFLPEHDIRAGDVFRNVTPIDPVKNLGLMNGNVYRILGPITARDGIPVAAAAYKEAEIRQEPHAPADLPA